MTRAAEGTRRWLRDAQRWFADAVMGSDASSAAAGSCARILTAGPRLSAEERLSIYRQAYVARLVECLADDYPAMRFALGEGSFEALCRVYIARHPSTTPNLNAYGRHMASLVRTPGVLAPAAAPGAGALAVAAEPPFFGDLAQLEWAIVEVIHAPAADPLTPEALAGVADGWAQLRLTTTPALRLLRFDYPVNAYFQAFREGEAPVIPSPAPSSVAVVRCAATVWRIDLSPPMLELLSALSADDTLGDALERACAAFVDTPEEVAAARLTGWFREWVSTGIFAGVRSG